MKFKKSVLKQLGLPFDNVIEDKIVDTTRWSIIHEIVFKYENRFWQTIYSIGATEYQDEQPWEYDNEIECVEVHKVEKVIEVWVEKDSKDED